MKMTIKKLASRYVKIVEWSGEDKCYVGRCPELFGGGCHGDDEVKVYAALAAMVEEAVEDRLAESRRLPAPIAAQKFSGKFVFRPGPELHKALSVRAYREGKSLNQVLIEAIRPAATKPDARKKLATA